MFRTLPKISTDPPLGNIKGKLFNNRPFASLFFPFAECRLVGGTQQRFNELSGPPFVILVTWESFLLLAHG